MRALLGVGLVGLVGLVGVGTADAQSVPAWLQARPLSDKVYPERAVPSQPAKLYLTPGAAAVAEVAPGDPLVVVEAAPDGMTVRAVAETAELRVGFYVDPAALPVVVRRDARITPTASPGKTGVRLPAGAAIEASQLTGDAPLPVRYVAGTLTAQGFLPPGSLGRTFVPGKPLARAKGRKVVVEYPVEVLDEPGGTSFASFKKGAGSAVRLSRKGRFELVEIDDDGALVVGWVPRGRVSRAGKRFLAGVGGAGGTRGVPGYVGPAHAIEVQAGLRLSAVPDGAPVAVALATATYVPGGESNAGWVGLVIPGPYGKLILYARRDDLHPGASSR